MPKVSVIIPVYDVERYLRQCLDSVCNQTLKDIEIICVNDCSPDNSLAILQEYAVSDARIKIIDFKENKGVSVARNTAMVQATGEYIGFVDPDDWIDLNFYEVLYSRAKACQSDLVVGTGHQVNDTGEFPTNSFSQFFNDIKEHKLYFNGFFTVGLYQNEMLRRHNIKFLENCIYGEDRLLPLASAFYAKNFQYDYSVNYYYREHNESITHQVFDEKILTSFLVFINKIFDFCNSHLFVPKDYRLVIDGFLECFFFFYRMLDKPLRNRCFREFTEKCMPKINNNLIQQTPSYYKLLNVIKNNDELQFEMALEKYERERFWLKCVRKIRHNKAHSKPVS